MAGSIYDDCSGSFEMETFETRCPHCDMICGVVPCHAFDPENVKAAGIKY